MLEVLEKLGFSKKEAQFYLATLELGKATIAQVSEKINVPRSSCYLILDNLKKKGFVAETPLGRKRTIIAKEPRKLPIILTEQIQEKQELVKELNSILPQLQSIHNIRAQKPKVRFYEGKHGIKTIYEESLNYPCIDVICMSQEAVEIMDNYLTGYFKRVIKKGITTCEIVGDDPKNKKYQKEYSTAKNIICCIPKKYGSNTDYMIYGNCVAFISYRGRSPIGIVIEDGEIADFEKKRFQFLWKKITK